jgi:hypothetical protein
MCSYDAVAEELIQKDDFILLFIGASSTCSSGHSMWRDANFTFLCTILNKSTNQSVAKYVHSKGCIEHYLKQLQNQQLTDAEMSSFLCNLADLLKLSAEHTTLLIEDMINANGFVLFVEFCKRYVKRLKFQQLIFRVEIEHFKPLMDAMLGLISAGNQTVQLYDPKTPLSFYPFQLNTSLARSVDTVRVPEAFYVMVQIFAETDDCKCLIILDYVLKILKMESMNYFILERYYPMCLFVEQMYKKSIDVQVKLKSGLYMD